VNIWAAPGCFFGDKSETYVSVKFKGKSVGGGGAGGGSGSVNSPMPGKISSIVVKDGDSVEEGDLIMVLEAMKMEHPIAAPKSGVVGKIGGEEGTLVTDGELLFVIEGDDDE